MPVPFGPRNRDQSSAPAVAVAAVSRAASARDETIHGRWGFGTDGSDLGLRVVETDELECDYRPEVANGSNRGSPGTGLCGFEQGRLGRCRGSVRWRRGSTPLVAVRPLPRPRGENHLHPRDGAARWETPPMRLALDHLRSDIRYALRQFARRPGLTVAALLALAAGLGS